MLIHHYVANRVTDVVRLEGRLTLVEAAGAKRMIKRFVDAGSGRLVIDLSGLTYIDSMGLALFVSIFKAIGERGGRMVLAGGSVEILALIELTRLHSLFELFHNVEDAIESVSQSRVDTLPEPLPLVAPARVEVGMNTRDSDRVLPMNRRGPWFHRLWPGLFSGRGKGALQATDEPASA